MKILASVVGKCMNSEIIVIDLYEEDTVPPTYMIGRSVGVNGHNDKVYYGDDLDEALAQFDMIIEPWKFVCDKFYAAYAEDTEPYVCEPDLNKVNDEGYELPPVQGQALSFDKIPTKQLSDILEIAGTEVEGMPVRGSMSRIDSDGGELYHVKEMAFPKNQIGSSMHGFPEGMGMAKVSNDE